MAQPSLSKIVEGMIKADSPKPEDGWTLGWDVVVSYSEEEINKNLASRWEKHRDEMIREIETKMTEERRPGESSDEEDERPTCDIKLELGAPRIQFVSATTSPTVNLLLPVRKGSSKWSDKQKASILPENSYQICLKNIPLGTVKGNYEDIQDKNRSGKLPNPTTGEGECRFENRVRDHDPSKFEVSWVVLDFSMKEGDLNVQGQMAPGCELDNVEDGKTKGRLARGLKVVKSAAEAFFVGTRETKFSPVFNVLRHALVTVKNKELPQQVGGSRNLTPKKFRMASLKGSEVKPILSLFIHVVDGVDEGESRDLQTRWGGLWLNTKGDVMAPIPSTHTASILIHPKLIYKDVLSRSLASESNKGWGFKQLVGVKGGGIAVHAALQCEFRMPSIRLQFDKGSGRIQVTVDDWSKDLKELPATIHLHQRAMDERPVISVNWEFSTETRRTNSRSEKVHPALDVYKEVTGDITRWKTTFKLAQDVPMKTNSTDYDITLEPDMGKLSQCWEITEEEGETDVWDKIKNFFRVAWLSNDEVFKELVVESKESMRKMIPGFKLGEMGLGFFLTTNLLNPGAKVIRIDKDVGFRAPGNLLLVGHVIQGTDEVKSGKV